MALCSPFSLRDSSVTPSLALYFSLRIVTSLSSWPPSTIPMTLRRRWKSRSLSTVIAITSIVLARTGKADECCSTHLIEGDGTFNVAGIENFMKEVKLGECGLSYAVVSIMGPQSSGKSTLLNHLFHTNFMEMDALKGRSQTTKGIWLANCAGIEPCTLV